MRPRAFERDALFVAAHEVPDAAFCEPPSPSPRLRPWGPGRSPPASACRETLRAMVADTLTAEPDSLGRAWDEIISRCGRDPGALEGLLEEVPQGDCHTHLLERLLADGQAEVLARLLPSLSCRRYGVLHRLRTASGHYIGAARRLERTWVPHGQGLLSPDPGRWVLGTWRNAHPDGALRCFADLQTYTGGLDSMLRRQGRGEVVFPDGERLQALWRDGARVGPALVTWPAAGTPSYFGEVADFGAIPDGAGTLAWAPSGVRLQGHFRRGTIDHGRYCFAAGSMLAGFIFQGPVRKHRPHGDGVLLRAGSPPEPCRFQNGALQARGRIGQRLLTDPVVGGAGAGASPGPLRHLLARDPQIRYRPAHEGPRPPSPRPPARAC